MDRRQDIGQKRGNAQADHEVDAPKAVHLPRRWQLVDDTATRNLIRGILLGRTTPPFWKRVLAFMGPAFVASVAYMDPGNFATNISAGARYGYMLLWVVVMSNLMAMLIQALSAKLGIATGRSLPELIRDHFPRPLVWFLWVVAELVAMATDLAEFLGAALGLNLLFGIPMWPAALITGVLAFMILSLEQYGFRPLEAAIIFFVGIIALCYFIEIGLFAHPDLKEIGLAVVQPRVTDTESVLLAVGILGATVMPHVIYLHSALTQGRLVVRTDAARRTLFRYEVIDVVLAMGIAGLINGAMLIMAAATFHRSGYRQLTELTDAYLTLQPLLGPLAATVFAVSLLASGLSSSTVGTLAGQVIMQGFLRRKIPTWLRRLVTMAPAIVVIGLGLDPTRALVLSQVVLSFGIPFAFIPLIIFTQRRDLMGPLVNSRLTTILAVVVAALIIGLNLFLLYQTIAMGF
ncbi:MAG TPA: Nramp family divalent metal transporter [Thermoflexus sp.]|nr:Nramp family divalent metal transporter [Thermoflexus sp.]